jgi:hypothetical protein
MSTPYLSRLAWLRVRELAANFAPVEQISLETALDPATVEGILAGRIQPNRIVVEDDDPLREEALTARRCRGCGGLIYVWPCLACSLSCPAGPDPSSAKCRETRKRKLRPRPARQ